MTLVQLLANETSLHMAADFCLSDPRTKQPVQNDAFKLVTVTSPSILALIGVTGIGVLDGTPVGTWIDNVVSGLGDGGSVEDLLDALAREAEGPLSRVTGERWHTFVVGAVIGTQTQLSLGSNFQVFHEGRIQSSSTAATALTVSSFKPKSPQYFATREVPCADQGQLKLMLRSGATDASIKERLRDVNVAVSEHSDDVSAGCYAASLHATAQGSSRPFLTDEQKGDIIPPEVEGLFRRAGLRPRAKIGPDGKPLPIRVRQAGFGVQGASAEYFQEQFKLRPNDAVLRDNYGAYLVSKGKLDEAMEAFELAKTLNPSWAPAIAHLAQQYWLHRADTAEAERLYTEALRVAGPSVPAWILSDFAVLRDEGLGETQRALELHERAVGGENWPLGKARLGYFLMTHGGDTERADALFSEALGQPDNADVLVLAARADWLYKGDREAARIKLLKACILAPTHVPTLRLTAYVCVALEDGANAAYYYRKIIGRMAADSQVHANYGLALLMENKAEGALRHLSKARRSGSDPGVPVNLAATLWVLRRTKDAVALMREILSQSPLPEIELEVLAMLRLAAPPATDAVIRLRQLISSGHQTDGITLRTMVRHRRKEERNLGLLLSDIIEGEAEVTPTL